MKNIYFYITWALWAALALSVEAGGHLEFFKENCLKCHDAKKHKGDVRLDLLSLPVTAKNLETWKEVVYNLQRGDMPPEKEKQPSAEARRGFLKRVVPLLARHEVDARGPADPLMRL